jgi:hypothetical protein
LISLTLPVNDMVASLVPSPIVKPRPVVPASVIRPVGGGQGDAQALVAASMSSTRIRLPLPKLKTTVPSSGHALRAGHEIDRSIVHGIDGDREGVRRRFCAPPLPALPRSFVTHLHARDAVENWRLGSNRRPFSAAFTLASVPVKVMVAFVAAIADVERKPGELRQLSGDRCWRSG